MTHLAKYYPPTWVPGVRRKFVIAFACEKCGGDMRIKNMVGRKKWMRCNTCSHIQIDVIDDGVRRSLIACTPVQ